MAVGFTVWSVMCVQIAVHEWKPRPYEPDFRTSLRRGIVLIFALQACVLTFIHATELVESSWTVMRFVVVLAGAVDFVHTILIHLLYILFPDDQPTVAIPHASGLRVGPPTINSYLPSLYGILVGFALTDRVRARISSWTGAAQLSVGLGQLHAGELDSNLAASTGRDLLSESGEGGSEAGEGSATSVGTKQSIRRLRTELGGVEMRIAHLENERQRLVRQLAVLGDHQTAGSGRDGSRRSRSRKSAGSSVSSNLSSASSEVLEEIVRTFGPGSDAAREAKAPAVADADPPPATSTTMATGTGGARQRPLSTSRELSAD